ncbi:hypothetical protein B0H10DRAFT_2036351 [Mycena sp. CBHHK59/15]|nr:hypothetical protein B0H10DRAFT_2036351 [Mycena sp. CBHHK59/15]
MGSYCGWYSWALLSLAVALLFCTSALHQDRIATFPTFPVRQTNTPVIGPCIFPSYRIHQPSRRITQDATNSEVMQSALLSSQVYEHEFAPLQPLAGPCSPPLHRAALTHQPVHATILAQPVLPTATPVHACAAAQCRLGVLRAPRLPGSM